MKTLAIGKAKKQGLETETIDIRVWKDEAILLDALLKKAWLYLPDIYQSDRHRIRDMRKIIEDFTIGREFRLKNAEKNKRVEEKLIHKFES